MRCIGIRVEPTVRLMKDTGADELLMVLYLLFDARLMTDVTYVRQSHC